MSRSALTWLCKVPDSVYRYRADVLRQLETHGIRPTSSTDPALVHELLSDLYRYELRRMRDRLILKAFARHEYFDRIVELRRRYPLVSLKPHEFIE